MFKKIKEILKDIFAPRITVTNNYYSKDVKPEDWKKIEGDFDDIFKNMSKMFESMDKMFKKL